MILTYGGVPLGISILPRNVLDPFNPLESVLRVFVSFTKMRVFLSFWVAFLNFLLHLLPSGSPLGIFGFLFIYLF